MTDKEVFEDARALLQSELGDGVILDEDSCLDRMGFGIMQVDTALETVRDILCTKYGLISSVPNDVRYCYDVSEFVQAILTCAVVEGDIKESDISAQFKPECYGYFYSLNEMMDMLGFTEPSKALGEMFLKLSDGDLGEDPVVTPPQESLQVGCMVKSRVNWQDSLSIGMPHFCSSRALTIPVMIGGAR